MINLIWITLKAQNMGTNFYYKIPVKKKDKEILQNYLDSEKFDELIDYSTTVMEKSNIHLGKRSYGWQFLWDLHDERYYQPTLDSITRFLINGGGNIYDEYGRKYNVDEFFDAINDCLYKDVNHIISDDPVFETINDNLRFSNYSDFS